MEEMILEPETAQVVEEIVSEEMVGLSEIVLVDGEEKIKITKADGSVEFKNL